MTAGSGSPARPAPRPVPVVMDRRGFLRLSGTTAAALATGSSLWMGGCSAHYESVLRGPGLLQGMPEPRLLSLKELAVLTAVVDRFIPDDGLFPNARSLDIAGRIDRELAFHGDKLQRDMKDALLVVEHGALLRLSPARFTALAPEEQDARLRKMASGEEVERQVVSALKTMACFFYYCEPATWRRVHYDGPLWKDRKRPLADSDGPDRPPRKVGIGPRGPA